MTLQYYKYALCDLINLLRSDNYDKFYDTYVRLFDPLAYEYNVNINFEGVPGLIYVADFMVESEVKQIQEYIADINFEPITNAPNSRRVAQYGYTYSYDRSGVKVTEPIPPILHNLVTSSKINNIVKSNILGYEFDQLIINEYTPGQQIAYHTDHPTQFDDIIVCITIGQSVPIMFKNEEKTKKLNVISGSLYIMTGDARYKWKHHLRNNGETNRYSLTFRKVKL